MNRNPHRLLDFIYSLVPPILLFAALDTLLGTRYFSQGDWPAYYYLICLGAAFATEQMMTVVSGWVFRGFLLGLVLGYPSRNLFEHGARRVLGILFPEYYAALPPEMAARLRTKFDREGIHGQEAQYLHAMARIQGRTDILARIDTMNSAAVCAQNLCLAALVTFVVGLLTGAPNLMTICAGVGIVVCFYRFLRVVRAHALELYLAYDYLTEDAPVTKTGRRMLKAA